MSATKLQNEEGKLISSWDVNSEKISYKSSRCSCIDCDSLTCFAKRNKAVKDVCQCGVCKDLKNCLSLTHKPSEERVHDLKENPPKKIIRETVTRETIESLKKVTETMYELDNNDNFKVITERRSKSNKDKNKPMDYGNIEKTNKFIAKSEDTVNIKKADKKHLQVPVTQGPSSDKLPQKNNNTATKLSAQVMNVPYDELHESTSSNQISDHNPLPKLNIFKRIKEIYNACSCKVCECISSKPFPLQDSNACQCKPCDCQDCTKLQRKINSNIRHFPHSGCPCIRCDRKDCRGIVKNVAEPQICDCKPCECIECAENFPKPCSCEPCQCINCKSLSSRVQKTVKLAKVDEVFHGETCKCSPCECIECRQIYNRTNPTIMWTTTTEMTRHRNCHCENCPSERCKFVERKACTCEKGNNTMENPFEKYNNYDIRSVIVNNNGPFKQGKNIYENRDTIAFFASLKNIHPQNVNNKNICKCVDCECIACAAEEQALKREKDILLRSNVRILQQGINMPTPNMNACKCSPCECEICSQKGRQDTILMQSKCRCDICDCLNCDKDSLPTCSKASKNIVLPIKFPDINNNCNCHPCECHNCKELLSCDSNVKFYTDGKSFCSKTVRRLRKVTLISPSSSAKHLQNICSKSVSSITLSPKKSLEAIYKQNIPTCHSTFQNDYVLLNHLKYHSNESQSNYNHIYDNVNDFALDIDFNLNIQANETSSCTSVQDDSSFTPRNNLKHNTLEIRRTTRTTPDKISESKSKNLNVIHEKAVKIANGSEESLPVLWTCSKTIHSRNLAPENSALTPSVENKDSSTYIEKIYAAPTHDYFQRYPKYSHSDWVNENRIFNNEHDVINLRSQKYSNPFSTSQNHSKNLDLRTSYQRATTVLHEAKAFSAKLIKMLDSFEAANRNFKSASQKFKNLHMSLLNLNETEVEKQYIGTLGTYDHLTFENTIEHNPEEKKLKNENEAEKEYEPSTSNLGHYNKSLNFLGNDISEAKDCNPVLKTDNVNMYISKNKEPMNAVSIPKQESNAKIIEEEQIGIEEPGKVHFTDNKDLNPQSLSSDVKNLSEANFNDKLKETQSTNVSKEDAKRLSLLMKKLDSVFGKETTLDAAIVTDDIETNKTDSLEQDERKKWNVLKKNLFLNTTPGEINIKMFGLSALEWDVKEAVQAISLNDSQQQNLQNDLPNANKALTNLRSEVRSLLNMSILQSNSEDGYVAEMVENACNLRQRVKLDVERNSMSSTAASQTYDNIAKVDKEVYFNSDYNTKIRKSCEDLKTSFAGLRRVSDHTVLVKWNLPKRIKDVQGYELLVNGRAVQKIFSPTRRMAVVTCLPNADRVLLTIHTIATTNDCGHSPATSIVYRPRIK